MGTHQKSLLIVSNANKSPIFDILFESGGSVFFIGKALELIGLAFLGAGLYIGCVNPYGLSEGKAMGVEMGSLATGILIFFLGRLLEKHQS